jgi:G:T/U mismatch-specific DNA glycosylase
MKTLPDYLREGLDIVSIGLNPSLYSVEAGFYFATSQNRFWKALNASNLVPEELTPGKEAMERLFNKYHIGFTDVVKRPSDSSSQLRSEDFREWAPVLRDKILHYEPRIAWFHGKLAYQNYLRYAEGRKKNSDWGEQVSRIGKTVCFVTPNPSSANAAHPLEDLTRWYSALAALQARLCTAIRQAGSGIQSDNEGVQSSGERALGTA